MKPILFLSVCVSLLTLGCRGAPPASLPPTPAEGPTTAAGNRVEIPPTVRRNLGITFARVEARDVARTIRVPGRFEPAPEARREYRTMAGGRVRLHATQYAETTPRQPLYTLDAPDWRAMQQRLNETNLRLAQSQTSLDAIGPLLAAHEQHHDELEAAVAIRAERVQQLEASRATGVVTQEDLARARGTLATTRAARAEVLEKGLELRLRQAQVAAQQHADEERLELLLANAGALLSLPVDALTAIDPDSREKHPRWREIRAIEVQSEAPGVIESLAVTNGAWVSEGDLVLTTIQPDQLRFRALGLQADLVRLSRGATARIAPPRSPDLDIGDAVAAELRLGLDAHPDDRTITLIARPAEMRPWMRPGVSAFLEVAAESAGGRALAIPRSAVVQDGLAHVFFRRDPKNPNQAIRIEADMGVDDGRWVVIHSGLMRGDEVVLDGAYELKLATSQGAAAQKGGHFHADGSYHGEH